MIVRFSVRAQADIQAIHDYIAVHNPLAASGVVVAIENATHRLAQFPLSGRAGAVDATRELVVPRLPYIAVYRVSDETVEIIGVFHAAQNLPRG